MPSENRIAQVIKPLQTSLALITLTQGLSVIKSTLDDATIKLSDIFLGAAPFALMMGVCLAAVIAFPSIATGFLGR